MIANTSSMYASPLRKKSSRASSVRFFLLSFSAVSTEKYGSSRASSSQSRSA
jgi:hypothetical protein